MVLIHLFIESFSNLNNFNIVRQLEWQFLEGRKDGFFEVFGLNLLQVFNILIYFLSSSKYYSSPSHLRPFINGLVRKINYVNHNFLESFHFGHLLVGYYPTGKTVKNISVIFLPVFLYFYQIYQSPMIFIYKKSDVSLK